MKRRRTGSAVSISACFEPRLADQAAAPVAEAECHSPGSGTGTEGHPVAPRRSRSCSHGRGARAGRFTQENGESLYAGVSIWKENSVF